MEFNWNEMVEDLGPRLYRYFHARFKAEEASDLTQETLLRLVRRVRDGGYVPERGSLRMYAFGIAHFIAMDALKISLPSTQEAELVTAAHAEDLIIERQDAQVARQAIAKLPPIQREILLLMIDEEMTLADISLLMKTPVGTLKSHIFRAKARLREILLHERKAK